MKTTIKIAVIAMMGMSLGVKSQHNYDNQNIIYSKENKVGIGVKSPYSSLDVRGNISVTGSEKNNDSYVSRLNFINYYTTTLPMASIGVKTRKSTIAPFNYTNIIFETSNGFNTLSEKMRISDNGNIGIGTTQPKEKLEINGSLSFSRLYDRVGNFEQAGTKIYQIFSDDNGSAEANIQFFRNKSSRGGGIRSSSEIRFSTTNSTYYSDSQEHKLSEKMVIKGNGNVGIGTTSPSSKLNIRSTVSPSNTYPPSEKNDYYKIKDYDLLYLQQDGNNKIGPSIFMKGFNAGNSFSGRISLIENGGANGDIAFLTSTANGYNQNEVMRITSKSTVGIGTTDTKGFELGVNGKIAATEVKVATYSNWADFVFKKDYQLPTLLDVENHIKEKGHLKDIPSAKEVEKNGFFLGEMDAKLLQKIEELTLYTIEQEKKIKALEVEKVENEKQQKEIDELKALVQKLLKDKN